VGFILEVLPRNKEKTTGERANLFPPKSRTFPFVSPSWRNRDGDFSDVLRLLSDANCIAKDTRFPGSFGVGPELDLSIRFFRCWDPILEPGVLIMEKWPSFHSTSKSQITQAVALPRHGSTASKLRHRGKVILTAISYTNVR
jgi:hypothetical protein